MQPVPQPVSLRPDQPEPGPFPPAEPALDLRDVPLKRLVPLVESLGERSFRATQLIGWLYRKGVSDYADMTDLGKGLKERLAAVARVDPAVRPLERHLDPDGTLRILWATRDGADVESVLIPERDHMTLCVSTQAGCRMGCRFCRTATLGLKRNLTPSEILGQIIETKGLVRHARSITNIVLMGMGEPLDNLDAVLQALEVIATPGGMAVAGKRVSVSTAGVVPAIDQLAAMRPRFACGLTISLGSAQDELRSALMPANRRWPLATLKAALQRFPLDKGRRLTIAYTLLAGVNDSPAQALELSRFLTGLKVKINLIPFNPWPGAPFSRPQDAVAEAFRDVLLEKNHTVIIRRSNGLSVDAACGQLVGRGRPASEPAGVLAAADPS